MVPERQAKPGPKTFTPVSQKVLSAWPVMHVEFAAYPVLQVFAATLPLIQKGTPRLGPEAHELSLKAALPSAHSPPAPGPVKSYSVGIVYRITCSPPRLTPNPKSDWDSDEY